MMELAKIHWGSIGFDVVLTSDGSPTLQLKNQLDGTDRPPESMHHSGGAASETELIYATPIREVLQKINDPEFLIVGLGLGYIELCVARESLRDATQNVKMQSFETVEELTHLFLHYLNDSRQLHPSVKKTYDLLMSFISGDPAEHELIKQWLWQRYNNGEWVISQSIENLTDLKITPHSVSYDAFSSKTNPQLWSCEFLEKLLSLVDESCLLATYACRASLKEALRKVGFEVIVKAGFMGKRNSTQGRRGVFRYDL